MKILILGKNGQLAQSLAQICRADSIEALALATTDCDITSKTDVNAALDRFSPEIVINTAAYNLVGQAEGDSESAFQLNTIAPAYLAKVCLARSIRFVTYSTDYVFDGQLGKPYVETDQPQPLQMYGVSKYAGEIACSNGNPDAIVIRTNGLYGGTTGSPQKHGNFVLQVVRDAAVSEQIAVSDKLTVNPTWSDDLARATLQLIDHLDARGIYHLASEGSCSWYEFAQCILEKIGSSSTIVRKDTLNEPPGVARPGSSVLANSRAKALGIILPDWNSAVEGYLTQLGLLK